MYELERLVEGVPFEVLNQNRDSVRCHLHLEGV